MPTTVTPSHSGWGRELVLSGLGGLLLLSGLVAVGCGVMSWGGVLALGKHTAPVLFFVAAMSVVTRLSAASGVFDIVSDGVVRLCRERPWRLLVLCGLAAVLCTVFFSIDTTAVFLTPVIVITVRRVGYPVFPYALLTLLLANTASLLLPVSNLTNLLAAAQIGGGTAAFFTLLWPAQLVGSIVPFAAVVLCFRELRQRDAEPVQTAPTRNVDRRYLHWCVFVLGVLMLGLLTPVPVWMTAGIAAGGICLGAVASGRRPRLCALIPWPTLLLAAGLFLATGVADAAGGGALIRQIVPDGDGVTALLATAGIGALGANAINNLPAFLALQHGDLTVLGLSALLIGVNAGAIVSPWGSLATLLWADQLQRLRVPIDWRRVAAIGLGVASAVIPLAVVAVWWGAAGV